MKKEGLRIGIVTFPVSESGLIPLRNLVDIVSALTGNLYIITGNAGYNFFKNDPRIQLDGVQHNSGSNILTRIMRYILIQLRISYKVARMSSKIDFFIFFIGGPILLLPMLTARLLRREVILAIAGSDVDSIKAESLVLSLPIMFMVRVNLDLSGNILLYTTSLIKEWNLEKYNDKICIAHEHFLDFDKFKIKKKFDERENLVGYIGRLSEEKGILNFAKAISEIIKKRDDLKILIGGDGQLCDKIKKHLDENNLTDKVELTGWIPHDELPDYLNGLKLVVLPSYTEGLPNLMLEAMACGTPVLATPVGAIPDVIKDGETGFIMEDNAPENIAENVVRALEHPDLERIVENARALVEREFTYEAAVEKYRTILEEL